MKSKYLEHIQNGLKAAGKDATITGSNILVEVVKRDRTTASGIILPGANKEGKELTECIVIATGAGFYDPETEEDTPNDAKVGDVVYVEPVHVRLLYSFPVAGYMPHDIGLIDDAQVLIRFRGGKALTAFRKGAGLHD
jgi:co-chaperonin GroES (HSP10)